MPLNTRVKEGLQPDYPGDQDYQGLFFRGIFVPGSEPGSESCTGRVSGEEQCQAGVRPNLREVEKRRKAKPSPGRWRPFCRAAAGLQVRKRGAVFINSAKAPTAPHLLS